MDARKYSVTEIDRMRAAIVAPFRVLPPSDFIGAAAVEDRLRTYMLNGTEPDELERESLALVDKNRIEMERCRREDELRAQRICGRQPLAATDYSPS